MTTMTTQGMTITGTTTFPGHGRRIGAAHATGFLTLLQRWSAGRRRRAFLIEQRRHDDRDRSDRYLDRVDETHQRQALVAFVQR